MRVRFGFEALFLILVAVGAALMELEPLTIVLLIGGALILVALIERASIREAMQAHAEEGEEAAPATVREPEAAIGPREKAGLRFWPRRRARAEEFPSPTEQLSRSHERRIEAEPAAGQPLGEAAEPEHEPRPAGEEVPGTAVTTRPLDLAGLEQPPVSVPAPRPRRSLARAAKRVVQPPPPAPPPVPPAREWNLWDLERRAREQAGNAPHAEEWSALFTHLRVFANADGALPKEFDELVRESFGELIEAP